MLLTLDPLDLLPEHRRENSVPLLSASDVQYQHLSEKVQAAIVVVGSGYYTSWDGKTHNNILPPEDHDSLCKTCQGDMVISNPKESPDCPHINTQFDYGSDVEPEHCFDCHWTTHVGCPDCCPGYQHPKSALSGRP